MIDPQFYNDIQSTLTKFFGNLNLNPVMPEIRNLIEYGIHQQFETEGKYFGGRLGSLSVGYGWFKLAPSTIVSRQKRGYWPGKILQQKAMLVGSVSASSIGNEIKAGVNMEYAKYLHYGTDRMPPRPILPQHGLPTDMLTLIADAVGRYLSRITK
jgi:phage gpG-like protein